MRCAGIDIGSRSIEIVIMEDGKILEFKEADTGFDPIQKARQLIEKTEYDTIMATGYGRNLFELSFDAPTVTEIKAHAFGVRSIFPKAETILDIGGQDSKVIRVNKHGNVIKFEMNDRCAAGTGKFLEIMAKALGYSMEEFGIIALQAEKNLQINSMCTVFAESEVTSLVARGESRQSIAKGLHSSVAKRATSMLNRISKDDSIVFTGGVANNPCIVNLLMEISGRDILVPDYPQITGAIGAAILAEKKVKDR